MTVLVFIRISVLLTNERKSTSHLRPENPGGHEHLYPDESDLHVPPFWHGLPAQWLTFFYTFKV